MANETTTAMEHLGNVLLMLENLSPMHWCDAYANALEFYNQAHPDCRVLPTPGYVTMLVSVGPMDWPDVREMTDV